MRFKEFYFISIDPYLSRITSFIAPEIRVSCSTDRSGDTNGSTRVKKGELMKRTFPKVQFH